MEFLLFNGAMQTIAKAVAVTTGTNIKTLLQIKPLIPLRIVEWGISFGGFAAAAPISVELIETDVAATVTAHAEADITKLIAPGDEAAMAAACMTLSTTGTGFTSSGEGSITAVRNLDAPQLIAPTTQYNKQFSIDDAPKIQIGKFARIRVHAGAAVDALCYIKVRV